jgi:uncharacterized protein
VRQLGVSSLTYHGAEHSRFVHSLGVFNFAQRIIESLCRRYGDDHAVTGELRRLARTIKAAALLHDLGHGPFSHMIERASGSTFDHEKMTGKLIVSEGGQVRRSLEEAGISPNEVAQIIDKTHPSRLAVDVVSSQLDADRMDYLLRDSLMTGVEYGVYDADWLLNAMCVGRDPGSSGSVTTTASQSWRLCLDHDRGKFAAEQMILARHHMMLQVYMHRVTRGYEVMLLNLFEQAARVAQQNKLPDGTPSPVRSYFDKGIEMSFDDWLVFDETSMVSALQVWSQVRQPEFQFLMTASRAFLQRDRLYVGFPLAKLKLSDSMRLQEGLEGAGLKKGIDWGLDDGEHLPYKGVYYGASKGGGAEEQSTLSILLGDGDPSHPGRAIENESGVMKAIDNAREPISRIYIHREKLGDAKDLLESLKIKQGGDR